MLCCKENIEGKWQEITLSSALGKEEEVGKELHTLIFEMQKPVMHISDLLNLNWMERSFILSKTLPSTCKIAISSTLIPQLVLRVSLLLTGTMKQEF